jgi:hypothetical protein
MAHAREKALLASIIGRVASPGSVYWGRDVVRGAFTPESSTFWHPAASPDEEKPVAPAAELSVCARNVEAFFSAAFQLYAAKDPINFHESALNQAGKTAHLLPG